MKTLQQLLPLTFDWIQREIDERKYMISQFNNDNPDDEMLRAIYNGQINALEAVRNVMTIELQAKIDNK